ncbi:aminotransferase class I/II-fold pyridoxal phosphate-dependent enzyme [Adhaeribacter swui]|uniref:Aminotransferase class I/II-fold pyridoxal phosphate-dependent enzyme n=1 Tax=Adhaeribacter swui TaxID=2086471 RepID=A0A7G7G388_9BACT|nr:aminotransferase class I/II-fold pyridoxal phosphate-dependent enzyme [Adhaeribacter swui]QNF31622.1 aminotransferase class I/II-fold pyridoxal phosphate-dependent enzyme [Adhaeribacter swui]
METTFVTTELPGRTLVTANGTYLYGSGTSYLGMARNEAFEKLIQASFAAYGTNYSSSRLSNVQLEIYAETENYIAAWVGAEAALTVSSGLIAGQMVVKALEGSGTFFYSPRVHPALWRTPADCYQGNYADWAQEIAFQVGQTRSKNVVILTNSLDALYAQAYDFTWLNQLPANKTYTIVIDDSHGFGITGVNGAGIITQLPALPDYVQVVVVSSLGKALGIPGGVILSNARLMAEIKNIAFFGSGSPIIPAYLAAFLQAETLYQQARQRLQANIRYFTGLLHQPTIFSSFPGYPVFYTPQHDLYLFLLNRYILISHFPYPRPTDPPITRVILNSLHTPSDIEQLAAAINAFSASVVA